MGEGGAATIDGAEHRICKHGMFSGHWTMCSKYGTVASATKANALERTLAISTHAGDVRLSAHSAFGRTMLLGGSGFDAEIAPVHPFTRRATITGLIPDFPIACFAFWLTALMWRRAARSRS